MMQNLWWAAGHNIVAIPLAAGVLATRGILLPPAFAAVLMSASTVIAAINAQLLRQAQLYSQVLVRAAHANVDSNDSWRKRRHRSQAVATRLMRASGTVPHSFSSTTCTRMAVWMV